MPATEGVIRVPEISGDARVRVFGRNFNVIGEFEGMEVNAYILVTARHVVVLDTMLCPGDVSLMMQAVKGELEGRTVLCINSHADWDHAWGNAYFTGVHAAPIIAHEHCLLRLQSAEAREELANYQQRHAIFKDVVLVPPTVTFAQGLTIHGGDLTVELLAAPGHHLDQIVAWMPELRLLLAFDAVEKPIPVIEGPDCVPHMFTTLERLIALQPQRVLCSHSKTTSPELVQANLAYLHEVERRSKRLLQAHRPTERELDHASALINFPFDEVVAGVSEPVERTFYAWAHENNIRAIVRWLNQEAQ